MWGCGDLCYFFVGLFWASIAVVIYGAASIIKHTCKRNQRIAKEVTDGVIANDQDDKAPTGAKLFNTLKKAIKS